MIVLDTNIVSYLMRSDPVVVEWVLALPPGDVRTTSITRAEVLAGIANLPDGRRKVDLESRARMVFDSPAGQGLPFDDHAAEEYAALLASRAREGRPISHEDCQIAAIAISRGASLASRDLGLRDCGFSVINPFAD